MAETASPCAASAEARSGTSGPSAARLHARAVTTGELVALTAGLTILLISAKLLLLPFPVETASEFVRWLLRLAIVASADVCFAVGLGVASWCLVQLAGPWKVTGLIVRAIVFSLFYVSGLYGVASVPIFRFTMVPLTLPALQYAGGPDAMASSVAACLDLQTVLALAVAPALLLGIAPLVRRLLPQTRWQVSWKLWLGLLCTVPAYGTVCRQYIQASWTDPNRWERRISASPHTAMLWSCVEQWWLADDGRFSALLEEPDDRDWTAPRPTSGLRMALPADFRPRNVLMIVLESTGTDSLSLYGSPHPTTPHLERLVAEQGLVFDHFYVQTPNSCKSLVSLTASVVPRLDWWLIVRDFPNFNVPTIAQVLGQRGYRSCFAHSGYWSWKGRDGYLAARGASKLIDAQTLIDSGQAEPLNSWGVPDAPMFQAVLDWIDERPDQPFFALAYTIETHHPYVAEPPLMEFQANDEKHLRYLNAVRNADRQIAWLVEQLAARGLADDTLVVITADHGECFGQHNQTVHSFSVYEPAVHVPLVMLHPAFKNVPQRRIAQVRQQIDLPYTLVSLLGCRPPEVWQGQDLFDVEDRRAYFFSTGNNVACGIRDGQYKYHFYIDTGHEELFDVLADPGELKNLATEQPQRCEEYRRRWGGLIQHQPPFLRRHGA